VWKYYTPSVEGRSVGERGGDARRKRKPHFGVGLGGAAPTFVLIFLHLGLETGHGHGLRLRQLEAAGDATEGLAALALLPADAA